MPIGNENTVIPGCGTHHVAVQARDWEESMKLYRDTLGMKVVAEFGPEDRKIALLAVGDGSHIELFRPKDNTPKPGEDAANDPLTHFALATSDCRAAAAKVKAAGYKFRMEPKDVDLGDLQVTICFFFGPSGEVIEFFETR